MADIRIEDKEERDDGWNFSVVISDEEGEASYSVDLDEGYWRRLTDKEVEPEELVESSFEFLLEREPKESILKSFNLKEIGGYFREYEEKISGYF